MALVVIDLVGDDEDIIVTEKKKDDQAERRPSANDLIRYVPQLEIVPIEPDKTQ